MTRSTIRAALIIVAGLLMLLGLGTPTSSAHNATDFYPTYSRWPKWSHPAWFIRDNFPTGDARIAVQNSFLTWNAAYSGVYGEPQFDFDGPTTAVGDWSNACTTSFNGVYWRQGTSYSGTWFGKTNTCVTPGYVTRFTLVVNQDQPWYVSSGNPPSTQWDLQSVVTHEVGHATGWVGHFGPIPSADVCNQSDPSAYMTMCGYDPTAKGTNKMRTLGQHDQHTLYNAYN